MQSGISWLHDALVSRLKARSEELAHRAASGVESDADYRVLVGRYKESERLLKITIPDLFKDFYDSDSEEEGDEF